MKIIKLTKGKETLVDDEDYEYLSQQKWYYHSGGYVVSSGGKKLLHRILLNAEVGQEVDHINGNKLDNRRSNLRLCSNVQNKQNRKKYLNNKLGYKGVVWHEQTKKYRTRIQVNGVSIHIGLFDTVELAAKAYDVASKKYFGDFASTNFGGNYD